LRVTPSASAASVIVKPKGSMHCRNTTPPGCGGFFMVMGWFLFSVVIDIINILSAFVETEKHPPVGAYSNRPKAFHLAFKRMQPQPRLVQVGKGRGGTAPRGSEGPTARL